MAIFAAISCERTACKYPRRSSARQPGGVGLLCLFAQAATAENLVHPCTGSSSLMAALLTTYDFACSCFWCLSANRHERFDLKPSDSGKILLIHAIFQPYPATWCQRRLPHWMRGSGRIRSTAFVNDNDAFRKTGETAPTAAGVEMVAERAALFSDTTGNVYK